VVSVVDAPAFVVRAFRDFLTLEDSSVVSVGSGTDSTRSLRKSNLGFDVMHTFLLN
jgi:hypothetical protein